MKVYQIKKPDTIYYALADAFKNVTKKDILYNRKRNSKKGKYYINIGCGYDTETTTIKHHETVHNIEYERADFAFVYHWQFIINNIYICGYDLEHFKILLIELVKRIKSFWCDDMQPFLVMWVANLGFEFSFIKKQLTEIGIDKVFAKSERDLLYLLINGCIEIRECLGLFGSSLERIARDYTKTQKAKGDLNYSKIRIPKLTTFKPKEKRYMQNDVLILNELSIVAHEKFTKHFKDIPYTATGILRQECKDLLNLYFEYQKNYNLMPETFEEYLLFRKYLFVGGLSHSNAKYSGQILHDVICADITSDYPAQFNHHFFPSGELVKIKPNECFVNRTKCYIAIVRLYNVKPLTSHSYISANKIINWRDSYDPAESCIFDNGRLRYGNNVKICINEIDLQIIKSYYKCQMDIESAYMFTARQSVPKKILELMNDYYLKKQQLKAAGQTNTLDYSESKSKVNSFYGMTCTKLYDSEYILQNKNNFISLQEVKKDKVYQDLIQKQWISCYFGFWCTSYARAIIAYFVTKYPDLIIQYDTDSLYYLKDYTRVNKEEVEQLERDLEKYNEMVTNRNIKQFNNNEYMKTLGTWDFEKPYKNFKCLGAKRYICEKYDGTIKPVISGCNKKAFIDYCKNNNKNPFDFFDNHMTLHHAVSRKLTTKYKDSPEIEYKKVTDYQGHTAIIPVGTFCALYEIPFKMDVKAEYIELFNELKDYENNIPFEQRNYEEILNKLKGNL